jgi:hypothetical protein
VRADDGYFEASISVEALVSCYIETSVVGVGIPVQSYADFLHAYFFYPESV